MIGAEPDEVGEVQADIGKDSVLSDAALWRRAWRCGNCNSVAKRAHSKFDAAPQLKPAQNVTFDYALTKHPSPRPA